MDNKWWIGILTWLTSTVAAFSMGVGKSRTQVAQLKEDSDETKKAVKELEDKVGQLSTRKANQSQVSALAEDVNALKIAGAETKTHLTHIQRDLADIKKQIGGISRGQARIEAKIIGRGGNHA